MKVAHQSFICVHGKTLHVETFYTGLLKLISKTFGGTYSGKTLKDVIESVTDNKDLREVLAFR